MATQGNSNGGTPPHELAAVDALAQAVATAVRVLNEHVDVTLAETLNYLTSAQADLDRLNGRIAQARRELGETRGGWQRSAGSAPPSTTAQSKAKLQQLGALQPTAAFQQKRES